MSAQESRSEPGQLAVLMRDLRVRVLNCSPSGCLLETNARMDTGATGSLHMVIDGAEYTDDIQVVRCQLVEGAGSLYKVGVRFLWNRPAERNTLRVAIWGMCQAAGEA